MFFANVCAGFIRSCCGEFWEWHLLGFLASLLCLVCLGRGLVLLVTLLRTRLGLLWCASCWTRLFGGVRREHYFCNHWRECQAAHKIACFYIWFYDCFINGKPYMLALAGRPSLHGCDACTVYWITGALRRICRQKQRETSFSPLWVFFCLVGILGKCFGC